jgi:hypothetical protein
LPPRRIEVVHGFGGPANPCNPTSINREGDVVLSHMSGDHGLVAHHDDVDAGAGEERQRVDGAGKELEVRGAVHVSRLLGAVRGRRRGGA